MKRLIIFFAILLTVSGCLVAPDADEALRVDINLNVENVGAPIIAESDTLYIDEIKFIVTHFNLVTHNDVVIQTSDDLTSFIYKYTQNYSGDALMVSARLGYLDFNKFNGYEIFVNKAGDAEAVIDTDFRYDGNYYSIVIKGSFNGRNFTFRTASTFEKNFRFETVEIGGGKETLVIRHFLDMEDVFTNSSTGLFINPIDDTNRSLIATQLRENLRVTAHAAKMIYY